MRDLVRDALSRACPPETVRAAWDQRPEDLWRVLAELGLTGASAPDSVGGLGLGAVGWVLLLEEAGRAAVPAPLIEAIAAAPFLAEVGHTELAEAICAGEATAAVVEPGGYALDADIAAVVLRAYPDRVVALKAPELVAQPGVDGARRMFSVGGPEVLLGGDGRGLVARATLATSAQLLGLGQRVLDDAVAYACEREQFRKPIGSFQAVQHHLVDAALRLKFAAPVVYRAAWSLDEGDRDAALHVSMAKLYAAEAARFACRKALQVHGAIGYTFELNLHLWMKRIWSLSTSWGSDAAHRDHAATIVLGD